MAAWEEGVFIKREFNKGRVPGVQKELSKLIKKITRKHGQNIQTVHSAKIMVPNKCMKNGHRGNANKGATTHDHVSSELRPDPSHAGGTTHDHAPSESRPDPALAGGVGEPEGLCAAGGDTTTHGHASSELRPDPAPAGGAGDLEGLCCWWGHGRLKHRPFPKAD